MKKTQNRIKGTSFNLASTTTFDPVSLVPIHPTQPSPREIVATARQMRGLMEMDKDIQTNEGFADIEFFKEEERILEMKEKHSEILFKVERYCIVIFALLCVLFNIFYWPYLLYA